MCLARLLITCTLIHFATMLRLRLIQVLFVSFAVARNAVGVDEERDNFFQDDRTWRGLMFPSEVNVTVGEDIFLRLEDSLADQTECLFRKTGDTDSLAAPKNKYNMKHCANAIHLNYHSISVDAWKAAKCGIIIKGIKKSDAGLWRLTSRSSTKSVRGVARISVRGTKVIETVANVFFEAFHCDCRRGRSCGQSNVLVFIGNECRATRHRVLLCVPPEWAANRDAAAHELHRSAVDRRPGCDWQVECGGGRRGSHRRIKIFR